MVVIKFINLLFLLIFIKNCKVKSSMACWSAAGKVFFPKDWERVIVKLPKHQAFIVKQWALATKRKQYRLKT